MAIIERRILDGRPDDPGGSPRGDAQSLPDLGETVASGPERQDQLVPEGFGLRALGPRRGPVKGSDGLS